MNNIYFTGYDAIHTSDFVYDVPEGHDCYLLILTTTPALFEVDGRITEQPAYSAVLYPPHQKIWYGACGETYGNHWVRFASDESFVTNFPKLSQPFPVSDPEYCRSVFQLLSWETSHWLNIARPFRNSGTDTLSDAENSFLQNSDTGQSEQTISQLLRILFQKLHSDALHHATSPHDHELLVLRKQITNNPQSPWTVQNMAGMLHMSTGYLQLLYKQKFGVSCMDDVIECRIRLAKDLLSYSYKNITEIAEDCGYNNTEHFCRQFRKYTGVTPGQYRKNNM